MWPAAAVLLAAALLIFGAERRWHRVTGAPDAGGAHDASRVERGGAHASGVTGTRGDAADGPAAAAATARGPGDVDPGPGGAARATPLRTTHSASSPRALDAPTPTGDLRDLARGGGDDRVCPDLELFHFDGCVASVCQATDFWPYVLLDFGPGRYDYFAGGPAQNWIFSCERTDGLLDDETTRLERAGYALVYRGPALTETQGERDWETDLVVRRQREFVEVRTAGKRVSLQQVDVPD
ncbi:MAG TPA: hypothetical protein VMV18_06330, partial [bacterium]|nr:hypothetical protein [bacterium]